MVAAAGGADVVGRWDAVDDADGEAEAAADEAGAGLATAVGAAAAFG